MPFSLAASVRNFQGEVVRLTNILSDMPRTANSRYALHEIVLIRATAVWEDVIAELAYKLACGAKFPSGQSDAVIVECRSIAAARSSMLAEGGALPNPKQNLKWTKARFISQSVKGVLHPDSHFLNTCQAHGAIIAEIFDVRNHAAHRNRSSKQKFQHWVTQTYGQQIHKSVGWYISTTNLDRTPKIDKYFTQMSAIIREIVGG